VESGREYIEEAKNRSVVFLTAGWLLFDYVLEE